jgi:hypothetical protein
VLLKKKPMPIMCEAKPWQANTSLATSKLLQWGLLNALKW